MPAARAAPSPADAPADTLLRVAGLSVRFGVQEVLRDLSLDVAAGETLVVLGESGCGKTVLLKALALCALMVQAGIPAPVGAESTLPCFDDVFADIGDEQSLAASLSTFSAHLKHLTAILDEASADALVLIDELGSGTDPLEGAALGGGFEVVLSCDLVVASKSAEFGLPEVKRSLVPICGGLFRSPKALPRNVARELLLTGDSIDAKRAHRLGLANLVCAPGEALDEAVALADRICRNGPVAVRETMRFLASLDAPDEAHGWEETLESEDVIRNAEDTREGVTAFFEKRDPNWSGR